MATSLEQQLKNLKTPQTSVLHDSRKRDSILFDSKEAAEKDRDTIYEIGLNGLHELIQLNPLLTKFETSLFDPSTKNVQRSVEDTEFNAALNLTIRKFVIHLSPFLMLDAAHKCLEWLIRRFEINRYNRDEFMLLILPYHETQIFVRCLQTVSFEGANDKWNWLQQAKKSAAPLAKRTLFNHALSNAKFMDLYGRFTLDAIKAWENRAHYLKTLIGFYCTTTLGALENIAAVKEVHLVAILEGVLKGMVCPSLDMVASTYMIVAHLVSKIQLSEKLLNAFILKIASISNHLLTVEAGMLLVLIYEVRHQNLRPMPGKVLAQLEAAKWLPQTLITVQREGAKVVHLFVATLEAALTKLQATEDPVEGAKYRNFCEMLIAEVNLDDDEAELVIETALNAFKYQETTNENSLDTITIDLDADEDDAMIGGQVTQWYSSFLKNLERQHPEAFDKVIKLVMSADDSNEDRRSALKSVLNFLLKVSHAQHDSNIFENLYHQNASQRAAAIKYVLENLEKIKISESGAELVKDSLAERLSDHSPLVVAQVLAAKPSVLMKTLDTDVFVQKMESLLENCLQNVEKWGDVLPKVVAVLTNKALAKVDEARILVAIFPLLFPSNESNTAIVEMILKSNFAKRSKFLMNVAGNLQSQVGFASISNAVVKALQHQDLLPTFEAILAAQRADTSTSFSYVYFSTFLLIHALPTTAPMDICHRLLTSTDEHLKRLEADDSNAAGDFGHAVAAKYSVLPSDIFEFLLRQLGNCLVTATDFHSKCLNLADQSPVVCLMVKILDNLLAKFFDASHSNDIMARELYSDSIKAFLNQFNETFDEKIEFLSNFYLGQTIHADKETISINPTFQLRVMKLLNTVLALNDNFSVTNMAMMRIMCAINSESAVIRQQAIETLEHVTSHPTATMTSYQFVASSLIRRKDELLLDAEQLPLILYMIISPDKLIQKNYSTQDKKHCLFVLDDILNVCVGASVPDYFVAKLMEITRFINNAELFEKVVGCADNIFKKVIDTPVDQPLSPYDSAILKYTLQRIDKKTVKALARTDAAWNVVLESLRCQKFFILDRKVCTPAILLMQTMDEEIFKSLPKQRQETLLEVIIDTATEAMNPQTIVMATKLIRNRIELDSDAIAKELNKMVVSEEPMAGGRRSRITVDTSASVLSTMAWKRGITILEMVQNKVNIVRPHCLINPLFNILKKCLSLEDQSPVEYTKQMLLATILQCCQQMGDDVATRRDILPDNMFKSDLVVQCIRATENPQTHHHALALLAHTAAMIPEQVLQNLVEIFTFMGSSVVRQDDAYSFQIISRVIENVIPIMVRTLEGGATERQQQEHVEKQQKAVIPILKVFAGILLDVPEHRRNMLYQKLLNTLGAKEYLWILLGVVAESHVMCSEKEGKMAKTPRQSGRRQPEEENESELPRRMQLMLSISGEFDPSIVLATCIKIIQYIGQLPDEIAETRRTNINVDITDTCIFSTDAHVDRDLRFFKYTIVQFVKCSLQSTHFINKIAALDDTEVANMKVFYQSMIIKILMYIKSVAKAEERHANTNRSKFWKIMLHHCYEILEATLSLLTPDSLLMVVFGLINHQYPMVRRKVLELFNRKLQYSRDYFEDCNKENMLKLLVPFRGIVETVLDETKAGGKEADIIKQNALIAIKLLSKELVVDHVDEFKDVLELLTDILKSHTEISPNILASLVLTITELIINLKAHALAFLPKFMPILLNVMKRYDNSNADILVSIVMSIYKIVDALPLFLSPYLTRLLKGLCQLFVKVGVNIANSTPATKTADGANKVNIIIANKLNLVWDQVATNIPARIFIPTIEECYRQLTEKKQVAAIGVLMKLLSKGFQHFESNEFAEYNADIEKLFLSALQFRCDNIGNVSDAVIDEVETCILDAFVSLVLKLSEASFKPLYFKIYDWAIRESASKERAITFYKLSSHVAGALKSLFVLFAPDIIKNAALLLQECNSFEGKDANMVYFADQPQKNVILIENILNTFYQIFLYDNQHFINKLRFEIIMQPIVDQLQNTLILEDKNIEALLYACVAQLAVAVEDEVLWKHLNDRILLKTRSADKRIRLRGLKCCVELAKKIGTGYQALLPDSVVYLAELLEDDNHEVERNCQKAIQEIEKVVGESLQNYF